jgi:hypothetical protein
MGLIIKTWIKYNVKITKDKITMGNFVLISTNKEMVNIGGNV